MPKKIIRLSKCIKTVDNKEQLKYEKKIKFMCELIELFNKFDTIRYNRYDNDDGELPEFNFIIHDDINIRTTEKILLCKEAYTI